MIAKITARWDLILEWSPNRPIWLMGLWFFLKTQCSTFSSAYGSGQRYYASPSGHQCLWQGLSSAGSSWLQDSGLQVARTWLLRGHYGPCSVTKNSGWRPLVFLPLCSLMLKVAHSWAPPRALFHHFLCVSFLSLLDSDLRTSLFLRSSVAWLSKALWSVLSVGSTN